MNDLNNWLVKNNVPENVKQLLLNDSFPYGNSIGSVRFYKPENIIEWNEFDLWPNMVANKLLIIGTAINGDLWTINYKQDISTIDILPFDNMPDKENIIPDTIIKKVANSFDEFLKLAKEDKLPIDFYDSKI